MCKRNGVTAEHAVAADRFARKIVRFLIVIVCSALAAAERQGVRRQPLTPVSSFKAV
jgi:hypothetical protein